MMKYILYLAILAQFVSAQDMDNYNPEVVSEWQSEDYLHDINGQCVEMCNRTCVQKCPVPELCNENEIECGKQDLPAGVWPDCIRDDICVNKDCECKFSFYISIMNNV